MTAKLYQFVVKAKEADSKDVLSKLKEAMALAESIGATGCALTLTSGSRPVTEILAGEIQRDQALAYAAASRLMQSVR